MRVGAAVGLSSLLVVVAACSSKTTTPPPILVDAGVADSSVPARMVAPPHDPVLTPCPAGWRTIAAEATPTVCEPWPAGGPIDCTGAQAHFPGEPGCATVGHACPSGTFSDALPAGSAVVYVLAGAAAGGDGSMARPFATIAAAVAAAPAGAVVAIGKGDYDEHLMLGRSVTLQGACAAETRLRWTTRGTALPVVGVAAAAAGAALVDLSIVDSPTAAIAVGGAMATLHLEGVVIANVSGLGLIAKEGAVVDGSDVVVRDTHVAAPTLGSGGLGIVADSGGTVTLSRVALERNASIGVLATGGGARIVLERAVVRDMLSGAAGFEGYALAAFSGSSIEARQTVLERAREFGVFARHEGSSVRLEDVVVRDTATITYGTMQVRGRGLIAFEGADAFVTRALFERNADKAIQVRNEGSMLELEDAVIRDTVGVVWTEGIANGVGLHVHWGASARVTRALVDRSVTQGVSVDYAGALSPETAPLTSAILEDVVVRDTQSSNGAGGRSIQVLGNSTVDATRVRTERSSMVAIVASQGARATFGELAIEDTASVDCRMAGCEGYGGIAAGAYETGTLALVGFRIAGSALCGVQVARGGAIDLSDGVVTHNEIGACVQIDGYDLERLTHGVTYEDNGHNLETTDLPVPEALPEF